MNQYKEWKEKQQEKYNAIPKGFAYSEKGFNEMLEKMQVSKKSYASQITRVNKLFYMKKTDLHLMDEFTIQENQERKEKYKDPSFLYDALYYEMVNHEYGLTYDLTETREALHLTEKELYNNKSFLSVVAKASKDYLKNYNLD